MTFKTAISQLHAIPKGEGLSYDYLWKAQRDSLIATLPFGYADGYPRNMRDKGYVIVNGVKAVSYTHLDEQLGGSMVAQGTTPRRLTDLIGSLCDLTSGSGDKGTPFIYIQGYFDNYTK